VQQDSGDQEAVAAQDATGNIKQEAVSVEHANNREDKNMAVSALVHEQGK